ncbi:MAG: endonuclease domain-containing protein, partial [Bacteroidota bacterium]
MYSNSYYNKKLKNLSRTHRNESTKAEIKLWSKLLSRKQLLGIQFYRQRPIGNYIVDFYSKELNLVIETDGISHLDEKVYEKDLLKERNLKKLGFHFIRFQDEEIIND